MPLTGRYGLAVTGASGDTVGSADLDQLAGQGIALRRIVADLLGGAGRYGGGADDQTDLRAGGTQYPAATLVVYDSTGGAWWFKTSSASAITFTATSGSAKLYAVVAPISGRSPAAAMGGLGDVTYVALAAATAAPAHSLLLGTGTITASAWTAYTGVATITVGLGGGGTADTTTDSDTPTNYTPDAATVGGHLRGIDTALGAVGGGLAGSPVALQFEVNNGGAALDNGLLPALYIGSDITLQEVILDADQTGDLELQLYPNTYAELPDDGVTALLTTPAALVAAYKSRLSSLSHDIDSDRWLLPKLGGIPVAKSVNLDLGSTQSFILASTSAFDGGAALTVMGWLWVEAFGGSSTAQQLIWTADYPAAGWGIRLGDGSASDRLQFLWCNGGTPHGAQASLGVTAATWCHVCAVYNAGTTTLYVNASSIGTGSGAASITAPTTTISIGSGNNSTIRMDEWAIYNAVKDGSFITAQYASGAGRKGLSSDSNLVAGYHFDGDAQDYSGHGHHLTPVNGPTYVAGQVTEGAGTITRLTGVLRGVRR